MNKGVAAVIGFLIGNFVFSLIGLLFKSPMYFPFIGGIIGITLGLIFGKKGSQSSEEKQKNPMLKIGIVGIFSSLSLFLVLFLFYIFGIMSSFKISEGTNYLLMAVMGFIGIIFVVSLVLTIIGFFLKNKN